MYARREFLKVAPPASGAVLLNYRKLMSKPFGTGYFGLNEFIESNPDAVFVLQTSVNAKTDAEAIKSVGHQLGQTLFVSKPDPTNAYPTATTNVVIRPNMTSWSWDIKDGYTIEGTRGIQSDANFVEGVVNSLNGLEVASDKIYIREANYFGAQSIDGIWYNDLAQPTGVNLKQFATVEPLRFFSEDQTNVFTLSFESRHPRDFNEKLKLGAEYNFFDTFIARVGYATNYDERGLTAGVGFRYDAVGYPLRADYVYEAFGVFGAVHHISIGIAY